MQWMVFVYFSWAWCSATADDGYDFWTGLPMPPEIAMSGDPDVITKWALQDGCILPQGSYSIPTWTVVPVFAIIILLAQIVYNGVETPARAFIYKALMGKKGPVRAGGAASMLAEQQKLAEQQGVGASSTAAQPLLDGTHQPQVAVAINNTGAAGPQ